MSLGRLHHETYSGEMASNAYSIIKERIDKSGIPDFIVDACLSGRFVKELQKKNYNVLPINELGERISDMEIINWANQLGIPIITLNKWHLFGYTSLIALRQKSVPEMVHDAENALTICPEVRNKR